MPIPLGVLIGGAAASLGGSLFNAGKARQTSTQNTERTIQAQKELAHYSYTKDLEMWNRANQYNSPTAQMARLKQANLNPNLVYGSGSVAGNTSTQTPQYQQYDPQYKQQPLQLPNVLETIGMFQDVRAKQAQVKGIELENVSRGLNNDYLVDQLSFRNQKLWHDTRAAGYSADLKKLLYGMEKSVNTKSIMASPYMQQYQATTQQRVQENALKKLELDFYEKIGVGSTSAGQLLQGLKFFFGK